MHSARTLPPKMETIEGDATRSADARPDVPDLESLEGDRCVYALPLRLLEAIRNRVPDWFAKSEYEREERRSRRAHDEASVGWCGDRPIRHLLFNRPDFAPISEEICKLLKWPDSTAVNEALSASNSLASPMILQMRAFLGWLLTNPAFLRERDEIRTRMGSLDSATITLGSFGRFIHSVSPDDDAAGIIWSYAALLKRWSLTSFAGWELPQPVGFNVGCSSIVGDLIGVKDSPVIQIPTTMRLPDRFPFQKLLHPKSPDPVEEWNLVLNERHPTGFNFTRWERILDIRFYRDIVLLQPDPQRLQRRVSKVDWAFADYYGDESDESVRKLRLWIQKRLASDPVKSARQPSLKR